MTEGEDVTLLGDAIAQYLEQEGIKGSDFKSLKDLVSKHVCTALQHDATLC